MKRLPLLVALAVGLICLVVAPAMAGPRTFVVAPSHGDDTAALQQAFKAATAAGPGSVVKLTAGRYYTNEILVDGFDGCFKGAGMNRTVIDTLRGHDASGPGVGLLPDPDKPGELLCGWPTLIAFVRSDVRVADMGFDITAADPSEPWGDGDNTWTMLSDIFIVTRASSSAFDRCRFVAHEGDLYGHNVDGAAAIYDTSGTHRVTRCSFRNGNDALETGYMTGGALVVGGDPGMGNDFDLAGTPCYATDDSDSRIEISYNRMSSQWGEGVLVTQGVGATSEDELPPLPAPRFFIHHNSIRAGTIEFDDGGVFGAGGVLLEDDSWLLGEASRLRAVVAYNCITMDNGGFDGGVNGVGAERVRVIGNRIRGTGIAGIDAGTDIYGPWGYPWGPGRGWRIVGNDVSKVHPFNGFDPEGTAAQIWLGAESSDCLVVGGCARTEVLDEGTDNILIHVTELVTGGAARALGASAAPAGGKALLRSQKF